jgi:surfeit locus 1 family protein
MSPTTRRLSMGFLLLCAAGFARLGIWQLSRLHTRRALNAVTRAARSAPPVSLAGPALERSDTLGEHRVEATGWYDAAHEIVLRGAVLQGVPGVRLVTPLRLGHDGPAVLVERGFVPSPDAVSVDTRGLEEPGKVSVRGIALPVPSAGGEPMAHGGRTTWRRLDLPALRNEVPYVLLPIYILQTPDSALPRFPRRLEPSGIDDGPHLNYAIQWFLFAALAAGFAFLVVGRTRPLS